MNQVILSTRSIFRVKLVLQFDEHDAKIHGQYEQRARPRATSSLKSISGIIPLSPLETNHFSEISPPEASPGPSLHSLMPDLSIP